MKKLSIYIFLSLFLFMQKFIIVLMERLQGLIAKKIVMGFIVKIQFILNQKDLAQI